MIFMYLHYKNDRWSRFCEQKIIAMPVCLRKEKVMIKREDIRDLICEEDGIGVVEIILILVVLIMLIVIFRKQITAIVSSAFSNINEDSGTINEKIELGDDD